MSVWEPARVLALAPDPASAVSARRLALGGRWTECGASDRAVWGRCRGSGAVPYQTVVELGSEPAYACSCPSRNRPCKHALGLLMRWSAGGVPAASTEADFAAEWLRARDERSRQVPKPQPADASEVDQAAIARRNAARAERVNAGLDDLDRWLRDQIRGGLAGVERAGYAHFDRVAARLVDAQAPGLASMLRSIPAELGADGWPARVLERLAAVHLLVQAHRGLAELPPELAANVRSRVGYPVSKAEVLAGPGVRDQWVALGAVDTVEYQLESRRVWLYGTRTGRWAVWLTFAAPGFSLDTSVLPGQLLDADLHFYPGSGFRALVGAQDDAATQLGRLPTASLSDARDRFAALLATDPWATRLPALVAVAPVRPERATDPWHIRDAHGHRAALVGLAGDPWPLLARSGGDPVDVFGEWSPAGFRPLSVLPDPYGARFSTEVCG